MSMMRPTEHGRGSIPCRSRNRTGTGAFGSVVLAVVSLALPTGNAAGQELGVFYPNIPGELLLENDKVVVQKFIVEPGQWEGVHTRPGDQI